MNLITYETLEEAEAEAKNQNKDYPDAFCPLINRLCNKKCVCWKPAVPCRLSDGKFSVYQAHCGNAMFHGERE